MRLSEPAKRFANPFRGIVARLAITNLLSLIIVTIGVIGFVDFSGPIINSKSAFLQSTGVEISQLVGNLAMRDRQLLAGDSELHSEPFFSIFNVEQEDFELDPAELSNAISGQLSGKELRVRVFSRNGGLLYDSIDPASDDEPEVDAHDHICISCSIARLMISMTAQDDGLADIEEALPDPFEYDDIRRALEDSVITQQVRQEQNGAPIVYVSVPVVDVDEVLAVVVASSIKGELSRILTQQGSNVILVFMLAFSVYLLSLFVTFRWFALPLLRLASAVRSMNAGNITDADIPDYRHRSDEVGILSEALMSMKAAIVSRIETIERFAADVSHEIKTPLTAIKVAADTSEITEDQDIKKRMSSIISRNVTRATMLINDIALASRIDAQLQRQEKTRFDAARLVENVSQLMESKASGRDVEIKCTSTSDQLMIVGREIGVAQILINLIENAVSFAPAGSQVVIACQSHGSVARIFVEDRGRGIPPGDEQKIFERFYSDREVAGVQEHSGLGLAISLTIATSLGGKLWATNILEDAAEREGMPTILGARFVLELPVAN